MRSARSEHPELRLRLVDLDGEIGSVLSYVVDSLLTLSDEPECAIREEQMLVHRMSPAEDSEVPPSAAAPLLRPGGAVLVTGGLGGLGAHVARFLASTHGVRDLVLVSRRGMETPNANALVAELASLCTRATVVASDVAKLESVKSIMKLFNESRPPVSLPR